MSQENKDEVNVLIIGNGLDISLDYPTKYGDFLNFCEMMQSIYEFPNPKTVVTLLLEDKFKNFIRRRQSVLNQKAQDLEKEQKPEKKQKLEQEVEQIQKNICFWYRFEKVFVAQNIQIVDHLWKLIINNIWIKYFRKIYKDKTIRGENWIDLEAEIRNVILQIEKTKEIKFSVLDKTNKELDKTNKELSIAFVLERIVKPAGDDKLPPNDNEKMYGDFIGNLRRDYDKFIVALDIYLDFFVSSLDISNSKKIEQLFHIRDVVNYIICFNYKNNFLRGYSTNENIETCMVHGNLKYTSEIKNNCSIDQLVNDNNMVIGFQDDSDDVKDLTFVYYRKYFQRIVKGTGNAYLSWFTEAERTNKRINVYVFGHSLGSMDADIFRGLFQFKNVHFTIFYYTDGKNTDLESKVVNLVRILGKDKVIKFTSGQDPVIKFEEQRYSNE